MQHNMMMMMMIVIIKVSPYELTHLVIQAVWRYTLHELKLKQKKVDVDVYFF